MSTSHRYEISDSRETEFPTCDLIVTSPPYPMVEMWDGLFSQWTQTDPDDDPDYFFRQSHRHLERVWGRCIDALSDGGTLCINIGDATRTIDNYQIWENRDEIVTRLSQDLRFIGEIVWQKPSNSPTPFMGSGTAPPNQYVTLDHEHILIFRKGENPDSDPSSSYFWNERNRWFSDIWDVGGDVQQTTGDRDVAASFPLEVPLRLILMYSLRRDLVLDPFGGTGTTGVAAAVSGRDSVCYDIDDSMRRDWESEISKTPAISEEWIKHRIRNHVQTVRGRNPAYKNTTHETSVVTQQEKELTLYRVDEVSDRVSYSQVGEFRKNRLDSF